MADRYVTKISRDGRGRIAALCDDGAHWSPRPVADVMADIESGTHSYFAVWTYGKTTIRVTSNGVGKYLRTDKEPSGRNNLEELPEA